MAKINNIKQSDVPRLTKNSMEDAPEEQWVEAVKTSVNALVDKTELESAPKAVKLLTNADVEYQELIVQVPDPWISVGTAPAFQNSWVNYDAATAPTRFMKRHDGVVEIRGVVKDGAVPSAVFTLPAGYRPSHTLNFASTSAGAFASVEILATGVVSVQAGSAAGAALNFSFMSLDSTPIVLSCWPKIITTKLMDVAGVVACGIVDEETSNNLPARYGNVMFELTASQSGGIKQIKILNIPWLPYNRKCRVKLLIFGK